MATKLIYLDACALLRPYDDLSQPRVRLEADVVGLILAHVRTGRLALAEAAGADFVTCDDRLSRRAGCPGAAHVWVGGPVAVCLKEELR